MPVQFSGNKLTTQYNKEHSLIKYSLNFKLNFKVLHKLNLLTSFCSKYLHNKLLILTLMINLTKIIS